MSAGFLSRSRAPMTDGSIPRRLITFALPILLSYLLQQLYNIADSVIVGNFVGKEALAAVGSVGSITSLTIGFFLGFSTGGSVVVSQYYGAESVKDVYESVHTAAAISLIGGVLLTVLGYIFTPQILSVMLVPPDVFEMSATYLRICFLGSIPVLVYNMGAGILRGVGNSTLPLVYLGVSAVSNILLDLLFVGALSMGTAGAALATVVSQIISAVLVVYNLTHTDESYRYYPMRTCIKADKLKRILKVGLPAGLQTAVISISNVIIQRFINTFGSGAMAGCTVAGKVDGIVTMPMAAIGLASMGFSGQNAGAGKADRVKKCAGWAVLIDVVMALSIAGIILLFRNEVAALFNPDPEVISYATQMIEIMLPLYWLFGIFDALGSIMRGAGSPVAPVVISLSALCVFRLIWLYVLMPIPQYHTITTVFLTYPVSWLIACVATAIMFFFGKWRKNIGNVVAKR